MIQCRECEHYHRRADGSIQFSCDPFTNIKEAECLTKWQLIKLDTMVRAYQATLSWYEKLGPLQEKMFRHMQREVEDIESADQWKYGNEEDAEPDESGDDEDETPPRARG